MMCLWTGSPLQIDPLQGLLLSWSWSVYRGIICRLYRRGWGDARILVVIMGCASAVWSSLLSQLLSVCVSTYSAKLLGYPRNCNNLRVFKKFFFLQLSYSHLVNHGTGDKVLVEGDHRCGSRWYGRHRLRRHGFFCRKEAHHCKSTSSTHTSWF